MIQVQDITEEYGCIHKKGCLHCCHHLGKPGKQPRSPAADQINYIHREEHYEATKKNNWLGTVTHAYNLKTRNPEADGSGIKGQFQLHESEASLSYDTLSQKFKVCVCTTIISIYS